MFKLYYPDGEGGYNYINQFASQILAETQAVSDNQPSYMIQGYDSNGNVTMVTSC